MSSLLRVSAGMVLFPLSIAVGEANQSLVSPGVMDTLGGVSHHGTVHSGSFNPANQAMLFRDEEQYRMGYLGNIGVQAELGEVDDLDVKVDRLVDDIDDAERGNWARLAERYPEVAGGSTDASRKAAYYDAIIKRANGEVVPELSRGGYVGLGVQLQAPLTPFVFRSELAKGAFNLQAAGSAQVQGRFLGADFGVRTVFSGGGNALGVATVNMSAIGSTVEQVEVALDKYKAAGKTDAARSALASELLAVPGLQLDENTRSNLQAVQANPGSYQDFDAEAQLATDSGLDVRAAGVVQLGLGYATTLSDWMPLDAGIGQIDLGGRLNLYRVKAGRNFVSLEAEANSDGDSSASDSLTEDFFDNTRDSTLIGLDLGALWRYSQYQAGITLYNLNEPTVDYPDLSRYVSGRTLDALQGLEQSGRTRVVDSVTLSRHAVLEGAWFSADRNWSVQGYHTLGTAASFVGDEYRNTGLSGAYYPSLWWVPGVRAGYNKNLAGSKLSTANLGFTLFGTVNLDMAMSFEKSSYDGSEYPRYMAFALGFEERF